MADDLTNEEIYAELLRRLELAERKHPVFAIGPYQAMGFISEEAGEMARAMTHGEGEDRLLSEAMDLLVVAWRFYRGDWRFIEDANSDSPRNKEEHS